MKFYLTSSFARHAEMTDCKRQIEALGHKVTSRWHTGDQTSKPDLQNNVERLSPDDPYTVEWALKNLEDVDAADCLLFFSSSMAPGLSYGRGGRFCEFGYALARAKSICIIGDGECIFQALVAKEHWFPSWPAFIAGLAHVPVEFDEEEESAIPTS